MDKIHESMTVHGCWCGEEDLGSSSQCPSMFPKRSAGSWPSCPGGPRRAPVKPVQAAVVSMLAVWYCYCSWLIRLPRRICAFALHCISLGACGSSHHTSHSASRLRYLALAPTYDLLRAAAYPSQCVISWSPPPPPPHTTHSPASITYRDLPRPLRVSALLPVSEPTLPLLVFPLVCPPPTCWF